MEECLGFIAITCSRAWGKSWSKLGLGVNIITSIITLLFYFLFEWPTIDIKRGLFLTLSVFICTFVIYCIWGLQAVFHNVQLEKRNTARGAVSIP